MKQSQDAANKKTTTVSEEIMQVLEAAEKKEVEDYQAEKEKEKEKVCLLVLVCCSIYIL